MSNLQASPSTNRDLCCCRCSPADGSRGHRPGGTRPPRSRRPHRRAHRLPAAGANSCRQPPACSCVRPCRRPLAVFRCEPPPQHFPQLIARPHGHSSCLAAPSDSPPGLVPAACSLGAAAPRKPGASRAAAVCGGPARAGAARRPGQQARRPGLVAQPAPAHPLCRLGQWPGQRRHGGGRHGCHAVRWGPLRRFIMMHAVCACVWRGERGSLQGHHRPCHSPRPCCCCCWLAAGGNTCPVPSRLACLPACRL